MFKLKTKMKPKGDQPQAIEKLTKNLARGKKHQTLLGVTGSGKTFTIANVIQNIQKPTLIIAPNKTLAAQLAQEFRTFFPESPVEYFVSYYDYYQPEAYIPSTDTYIDKESDINKEIERLRLAATAALMTRSDVIIVASVSCIYGLGTPETYQGAGIILEKGKPHPALSSKERDNFDGRDAINRVSAAVGKWNRTELMERFIEMHFTRSEVLSRGTFRWHGQVLEIMPAEMEIVYRLEFKEDKIDKILEFDSVTRNLRQQLDKIYLYPAKHFVVPEKMMEAALKNIETELDERLEEFKLKNELLAAERIERRTRYDLAMMREIGYCSGIENYSRHLTGRAKGEAPYTLIDYFPRDFLMVIDESHVTVPQINGMYAGDRARKKNLIDNGFRLPSAYDNRPLNFNEFEAKVNKVIYTSATPSDYEKRNSAESYSKSVQNEKVLSKENPTPALPSKGRETSRDALQCVSAITMPSGIIEQIIRPTGLVDPEIIIKPITGQVDDLVERIKERIGKNERILVTTLTKKMAEDLTDYLNEQISCSVGGGTGSSRNEAMPRSGSEGYKIAEYLHSEVKTMERVRILDNLRKGTFSVLVGVNLLREGLDLPEVSLVAILDADKEGFLRSETSLIQTIGRAARNINGQVIFYADNITGSMKRAIDETNRRRKIQVDYNKKHKITPESVKKEIKSIVGAQDSAPVIDEYKKLEELELKDIPDLIKIKEKEMKKLSANLEFERAALVRDEIRELKRIK